jgi:intein/homing endonuclease
MTDFMGMNLEFKDFDRLLKQEELVEEPVPIEVFVQDKKYLGLPPLSPIQLEIVRHSTQIYKQHTLIKLMGEEKGAEWYKRYTDNEVICMLGKGSGKDHCSRISIAYTAYLLHCLRDPLGYYGKATGVYVDLLNLAVNAQQAQRVFFEPLKNLLLSSPFFNEVGFEPRVSEIFFFSRPVRCFSGHSESEGWEGYEVMTVVLDEISAFKALGYNTPVLTPNGWVKNGELIVGDYVIGKNGKKVEVVGVYPQGVKEVYRVSFEDGAYVDCSEDHIWNVFEYSDGRRVSNKNIQLKNFKSIRLNSGNRQYRYSVPVVDPVEFEVAQELKIDPYLLGILISEGSLNSNGVRFSNGDSEVIEKIRSLLPSGYSLNKIGDYDYSIVYAGSGNPIKDALREYGLLGTVSNSKFIPDLYLFASVEDRKKLLAGLMDGDGTYSRGQGSYTTVSERLKNNLVELCRGLGGVPTSSKQKSWSVNHGVRKNASDKWMICPRVPFNPFSLSRKASKWKPHRRSLRKTIVDVQKLDTAEEMVCIKVANEDGLYVVNDYVVTHNTDMELRGELRSKGSASAIYNMSKLSVMSRFPEVGKVILLSFPRYKGDFIQQRFFSARDKQEPKTWSIKAATWEVNPTIKREDLESEYIRNPIEARARFECDPPNMEDAYFRDPDSVRKAFSYHDDPIDENGVYKPWFNNKDNHIRFIHIDLGLKRDRAALAMSHCAGFKEVKTSMGVETLPIINVDLVYSWEATPGNEINFASVRTLIVDLCRRFDVAKVTFDRWQSIEMVQSLKSQGINADFHSVKKSDYDTLMTSIYDKRLRGYWNEILVEEELLKLRLFANNKIDHPNGGSKDLADAVAGSVFSTVENIAVETEIEIEVWYPGEVDEDEQNFGNVRVYDPVDNKFVPAYQKSTVEPEGIGKWLEQI